MPHNTLLLLSHRHEANTSVGMVFWVVIDLAHKELIWMKERRTRYEPISQFPVCKDWLALLLLLLLVLLFIILSSLFDHFVRTVFECMNIPSWTKWIQNLGAPKKIWITEDDFLTTIHSRAPNRRIDFNKRTGVPKVTIETPLLSSLPKPYMGKWGVGGGNTPSWSPFYDLPSENLPGY